MMKKDKWLLRLIDSTYFVNKRKICLDKFTESIKFVVKVMLSWFVVVVLFE